MTGVPAVPRWVAQRQWSHGVLPVLAVGLFVWSVGTIWASGSELAGGPVAEVAVAAAMTLPLVVADRFPLPAGLLVCAGVALDYWLGGTLGQAWFAMLVAVFVVASRAGAAARGVVMLAVATLTLAVDLPRLRADAPLDEVLPGWFVIGAVYGLGRWVSTRRADQARLHERAVAAEADRDEATRAAVTHERALIARELHDLVAHSLSVIVLQAQGGQRAVRSDPEAAQASLRAIEGLGRDGMSELRRLLGIMASDREGVGIGVGVEQESEAGVVPNLAGLAALVARVRAAGLPVELLLVGVPAESGPPLAAGLELTAYRIVQEALTNSLRHAGPATALVRVTQRADALEVSVLDTGAGGVDAPLGSAGAGRGLIGMRERAALFGGTLVAGPRAGGGFEVVARFPLEVR